MDSRILDKVLITSKKFSKIMPEETGVYSSLSDEEIKEYIEEVLAATHRKTSKHETVIITLADRTYCTFSKYCVL